MIRLEVKSRRPSTLKDAIGFTYMFDPRNQLYKRTVQTNSASGISSAIPKTKVVLVKKFSYEELKERREKGLCYHCDEKFLLGQACKKIIHIGRRLAADRVGTTASV